MGLAGLLTKETADQPTFGDLTGISGEDQGPEMTPDPVPGKPASRTRRKAAMKAAPRASVPVSRASAVKDLTAELEMYAQLAALSISARGDEPCAAALSAQSREIAASIAVLIARSEKLLSIAASGGLIADITRLLMAAWPVASAVRAHHGPGRKETTGDSDALAGFPAYAPAAGSA
jgi:hypothetical protein